MTIIGEASINSKEPEPLGVPNVVLNTGNRTVLRGIELDTILNSETIIANDIKYLSKETAGRGFRGENFSVESFLESNLIPLSSWNNYEFQRDPASKITTVSREAEIVCCGLAGVLREQIIHNRFYRVIGQLLTLSLDD